MTFDEKKKLLIESAWIHGLLSHLNRTYCPLNPFIYVGYQDTRNPYPPHYSMFVDRDDACHIVCWDCPDHSKAEINLLTIEETNRYKKDFVDFDDNDWEELKNKIIIEKLSR